MGSGAQAPPLSGQGRRTGARLQEPAAQGRRTTAASGSRQTPRTNQPPAIISEHGPAPPQAQRSKDKHSPPLRSSVPADLQRAGPVRHATSRFRNTGRRNPFVREHTRPASSLTDPKLVTLPHVPAWLRSRQRSTAVRVEPRVGRATSAIRETRRAPRVRAVAGPSPDSARPSGARQRRTRSGVVSPLLSLHSRAPARIDLPSRAGSER